MFLLSSINDRIRKRREELGITQDELARRMGYKSRSSINKIEKNMADIPQSKIESFASALDTTCAYLMGIDTATESENIIDFPSMTKVPLIGSIACGTPILAQENIEDYVSVPDDVRADFCLRCSGDSMTGARIFDGDIVFIRSQPNVENGEIAAVLIDDEATLKRVYIYPGKLVLQPENPAYAPLVYVKNELNDIRILGKAVAFFSSVI